MRDQADFQKFNFNSYKPKIIGSFEAKNEVFLGERTKMDEKVENSIPVKNSQEMIGITCNTLFSAYGLESKFQRAEKREVTILKPTVIKPSTILNTINTIKEQHFLLKEKQAKRSLSHNKVAIIVKKVDPVISSEKNSVRPSRNNSAPPVTKNQDITLENIFEHLLKEEKEEEAQRETLGQKRFDQY